MQVRLAFGALAGLALASPALADPCKLIPDKGPTPAALVPGQTFSGPVVYVGDGDSLCVALGPSAAEWAEVRLADFYAPELQERGGAEAKSQLEQVVSGRRLQCVARHRSYDRVVARCTIAGRAVGDRMREAGAPEGGNR